MLLSSRLKIGIVTDIIYFILSRLVTNSALYSADTVRNKNGTENISNNFFDILEFLKFIDYFRFSIIHRLEINDSASETLLRNLDINLGLCNSVRTT